jgi:hypothetical protein
MKIGLLAGVLCLSGLTIIIECSSKSPVTPTTYQLTVTALAGGRITAPATSPVTVNSGASTQIAATADAGYRFVKWAAPAGSPAIGDTNSASTTVTLSSGSATVQAVFAATASSRNQLTVIALTGGTIVAPSSSTIPVDSVTSTAIAAQANAGYSFARWISSTGNASVAYSNASHTSVKLASGDDTLSAQFIPVPALPNNVDVTLFQRENGANFSYYIGTWAALPDFSTLTPDSSGPCDSMDVVAIAHQAHNFGAVFTGYLNIPIDGDYTFYLASSDGSALLLNDSMILNNDGIHAAAREDSAVVSITQGTYVIEVRYFNASSSAFLNVSYSSSVGIPKTTLLAGALVRAYTGPVARLYVTQPAGGETYHLGDVIHAQWTYKNPRAQVFASISVDGGKTFQNISLLAFPTAVSSYDWQIPADSSYVTQLAYIKVEEYPPYTAFAVSKAFTIAR